MFTTAPPLEEDALHSLSSQTASSAAVGTNGRFEGERSRGSGGASILARSAQLCPESGADTSSKSRSEGNQGSPIGNGKCASSDGLKNTD